MFFHVLKDRHDFDNPVSEVEYKPENNEQDRVLTFDEQRAYLAAASATLRDVAVLILETGMRPEEVYRARVEEPDLKRECVSILTVRRRPHGAMYRLIPLRSVSSSVGSRGPRVLNLFPNKKDKDRPMLKVNNAHYHALKECKVKKFRLYDLQHTWTTRAARTMDAITLASLLGHSKLNMITRYVHVQKDHQIEAVKKLEAANAAKQIAEMERLGTILGTGEKPASGEPLVN